ncbi:MAG: hypothetical protein R2706_15825 [Acidimicrobiales bacterium]
MADVLVGVPSTSDGDDSYVAALVSALELVRAGDAAAGFGRLATGRRFPIE